MNVERVPLATGLTYELASWDAPGCDHTLLLLHGYLDLAWGWKPFVDTGLFAKYHVLAPSFRGHGGSDWIGAGAMYYFFDYIADIASLVSSHARKRLSIVGHSMGGMVAAYFAGTYPERVEKLVSLEGFSVPEDNTSPERLRTSNGMRNDAVARRGTQAEPGSRRFASLADAAARMRHHDSELDEPTSLMLAEHGCVQLPSGEWTFRHDPLLAPRAPVGFELAIAQRFWGNITCPTLYVEGGRSWLKLSAEQRKQRIGSFRNLRSATLPDASHMMIRHRPDNVAQLVLDFLGGQS